MAGTQGFEPRYAAPEAAVLPLDDVPTKAKPHFTRRGATNPPWQSSRVLNRFGETWPGMAFPVGQTLGQTASFRQTAPETRCQSWVCDAFPPSAPKRLSTRSSKLEDHNE